MGVNAIAHVDELIKEYLLFRGFTSTIRAFDVDKKNDKMKGFMAEKVLQQLHTYVSQFDAEALLSFWEYLHANFFARLDESYAKTVTKLGRSLRQYYLVNAVQNSRMEKVVAFFAAYGDELYASDGAEVWRDWFALPYVKHPETDSFFEPFFTKLWVDAFALSLSNFLSTIFQHVPLPRLLAFHVERAKRSALAADMEKLRFEVHRLQEALKTTQAEVEAARRHRVQSTSVEKVVLGSSPPAGASANDSFKQMLRRRRVTSAAAAREDLQDADGGSDDGRTDTGESTPGEPFIVLTQETYTEHTRPVNCCLFSADGSSIASASADGTARLWTFSSFPNSRNAVIPCNAEVLSLEWEVKTDRLLLCGTASRSIKLWNVDSKSEVCTLLTDAEYPRVVSLACSPSEHVFACGAASGRDPRDGRLLLWNLKALKVQATLAVDPAPSATGSLAFSPSGRMLLAGGADGMLRVYDMTTCTPVMGWPAHTGGVTAAKFTPDEKSVISHGRDGRLLRWSLDNISTMLSQYEVDPAGGPSGGLRGLAIDGEGDYMLVGTPANRGAIYPIAGTHSVQSLGGHTAPVIAVDWHPSLNCAVTGSADTTVRVSKLLKAV